MSRYGVLFAFSLKPYDIQRIVLEDTHLWRPEYVDEKEQMVNTFVYSRPVGTMYENIYDKLKSIEEKKREKADDSRCPSCCEDFNLKDKVSSVLQFIFMYVLLFIRIDTCFLKLAQNIFHTHLSILLLALTCKYWCYD